jgi:hypothetical protein
MMQHELAPWVQWHGRLMVLAWVILLPLGVLIARFDTYQAIWGPGLEHPGNRIPPIGGASDAAMRRNQHLTQKRAIE